MVKKWLRFITELVFASSQAPQRQAAAKPGRMGLLEGNKKVNAADSELHQRSLSAPCREELMPHRCSRAQFPTRPWQNRQFSWLRTLCWNGNSEHQVSGHHSKPCSLFLLSKEAVGNHPGPFAESFKPLQRKVSLPGVVCFLNSDLPKAVWGSLEVMSDPQHPPQLR